MAHPSTLRDISSAIAPGTKAWPGPARQDDAVATFRCTDEGRAWQRSHFDTVLHAVAPEGRDGRDGRDGQRAGDILMSAPMPVGLEPAAYAKLVECYVAEMLLGANLRRTFMRKLLLMHAPPAVLQDVQVPMVMPLLAEFETALASIDPQLRTLFVAELRAILPPPAVKRLQHIV